MTVKPLLFFYLYLTTNTILIKKTPNLQKLDRQLSLLNLDQKTDIQKQLRLCGTNSKCRKKTLFEGLELIFNKPNKRALKIKTMNIMHILFIVLFIFLMFNSNLSASLFLSGLLLWSLINLLNHGGKMRKLALDTNEKIIFKKYGKSHMKKLFDKERSKLFHFFEDKNVKFRKLNKKRLRNLSMDYFDIVHDKSGKGLEKNIRNFVDILFKNSKSIKNKIIQFTR